MYTASDCARARKDFPSLSRTYNDLPIAYLDGPAGTQVPQRVIDAVGDYYRHANANTGGMFSTSRDSGEVHLRARRAAAAFLGAASSEEISFGANMTTLTHSLAHAFGRRWEPGDEVVISAIDHEANRGPWRMLERYGLVVREIALQADGRLDPEGFASQIGPKTKLVALGLSSNALGTVNDVALARRLSKEVGAYLVLDAVHHAAHFPVDVQAIDCDFLLCSGYKFYGPHVGVLYARAGLLDDLDPDRLSTQTQTAAQRIETGTPNFAAIAGLEGAIEYIASFGDGATLRDRVVSAMSAIGAYEHQIAARYAKEVAAIEGVTVWGPDFESGERAPTVSITIDGVNPAAAAAFLGERAVQVWDGHFYAVRTIESLGLVEAGGVLRIGIVMYNTDAEVDRLLAGVSELASTPALAAP